MDKMGIEETTYDFHDIVPKQRELIFAERNLPTFLGLVRGLGYFQPAPKPEVEQRDYPVEMTVRMPQIPWGAGRDGETHRPFVYVFDRAEEIVDRMRFGDGQKRKLLLQMDRRSFEDFYGDIPARGDDNMFGDVMFALIAVQGYADERFEAKGFRVLGAGTGTGYDGITLDLQRV